MDSSLEFTSSIDLVNRINEITNGIEGIIDSRVEAMNSRNEKIFNDTTEELKFMLNKLVKHRLDIISYIKNNPGDLTILSPEVSLMDNIMIGLNIIIGQKF